MGQVLMQVAAHELSKILPVATPFRMAEASFVQYQKHLSNQFGSFL